MNTNTPSPLAALLAGILSGAIQIQGAQAKCECPRCTAIRARAATLDAMDKRDAEAAAESAAAEYAGAAMASVSISAPCDFGWALAMLREGYALRRAGWNGKGLAVRLQIPDANSKMTLPYLYIEYPADAVNTPGARCPWLASQTDILAMDWEIA